MRHPAVDTSQNSVSIVDRAGRTLLFSSWRIPPASQWSLKRFATTTVDTVALCTLPSNQTTATRLQVPTVQVVRFPCVALWSRHFFHRCGASSSLHAATTKLGKYCKMLGPSRFSISNGSGPVLPTSRLTFCKLFLSSRASMEHLPAKGDPGCTQNCSTTIESILGDFRLSKVSKTFRTGYDFPLATLQHTVVGVPGILFFLDLCSLQGHPSLDQL